MEVDVALSQTRTLKSPSPDGFTSCFYQRSWQFVRDEVCRAVLNFLNDGIFDDDDDVNTTYIALVPNIKKPISHYRI